MLIGIIRAYQRFVSPYIGKHCRFYPSCSEYCCLAIKKYGPLKGLFLGVKRILRCNPWSPGGIDQP